MALYRIEQRNKFSVGETDRDYETGRTERRSNGGKDHR